MDVNIRVDTRVLEIRSVPCVSRILDPPNPVTCLHPQSQHCLNCQIHGRLKDIYLYLDPSLLPSSFYHTHHHPRLRQVGWPLLVVAFHCTFMWSLHDSDEHAAGGAMRRRQRRLRSWLRHERITIAMALVEMTHHTAPRGPKMATAWEGGNETQYPAEIRETPSPAA